MYALKVYKNTELVEQQECNGFSNLKLLIGLANKTYKGYGFEIWRDGNVLIHKGLLDFPEEDKDVQRNTD